jgi:hypothetical protein
MMAASLFSMLSLTNLARPAVIKEKILADLKFFTGKTAGAKQEENPKRFLFFKVLNSDLNYFYSSFSVSNHRFQLDPQVLRIKSTY